MDNIERMNARITSVMLGYEDHGIFTCNIGLQYDGAGQSFGGYCLDKWSEKDNRRVGTAYGLDWIIQLLKTLDISTMEELNGLPVRVEASFGKVHRIGHFLKDQWFDPELLIKEYYGEEKVEK